MEAPAHTRGRDVENKRETLAPLEVLWTSSNPPSSVLAPLVPQTSVRVMILRCVATLARRPQDINKPKVRPSPRRQRTVSSSPHGSRERFRRRRDRARLKPHHHGAKHVSSRAWAGSSTVNLMKIKCEPSELWRPTLDSCSYCDQPCRQRLVTYVALQLWACPQPGLRCRARCSTRPPTLPFAFAGLAWPRRTFTPWRRARQLRRSPCGPAPRDRQRAPVW